MINVVHPAYHCDPKGGQGSFFPSASRRFNCDLVFATILVSIRHGLVRIYTRVHSAGYVMAEAH